MTARLICCALLAGLALGCATSNDTAPAENRSAEAPSNPGEPEARTVTLEGDVDPQTIKALAEHLQGLAEIHTVEIEIHDTTEGPLQAQLTLGGFDMPNADELRDAVADFEGLDGLSVSVGDAPMPRGPVDAEELGELDHDDKTPEEIKAEVIEKLRAQGVEGDIQVDVTDEDGERRVEVRVEQHKDDEASDE